MRPKYLTLLLIVITARIVVADDPTYSRDIAPIFQQSCQQCHHEGEAAPMSLTSYSETRPWAKAIVDSVVSRTMPPWHADPAHGEFENDPRLKDSEIELVRKWVAAGAPEGDPKDLPPPLEFDDDWSIGVPDLVVTIPTPHSVPATGDDEWVDTELELNLDSDKWIQAVEVRPSSRRVVHHVMVYVMQDEEADPFFTGYLGRSAYLLSEHAIGNMGDVYPPGTGRLLKKNAKLLVQVHYHPNGTPETDQTSIGLKFHTDSSSVRRRVVTAPIANFALLIPANEAAYPLEAKQPFDRPAKLISFQPHMHFRGKSMRLELLHPDGRMETLCWVPKYNPNWQITYVFKSPVTIPAGAALVVNGVFDNSKDNPLNPDSEKEVKWGPFATDEMMIGWIDYYPADLEG